MGSGRISAQQVVDLRHSRTAALRLCVWGLKVDHCPGFSHGTAKRSAGPPNSQSASASETIREIRGKACARAPGLGGLVAAGLPFARPAEREPCIALHCPAQLCLKRQADRRRNMGDVLCRSNLDQPDLRVAGCESRCRSLSWKGWHAKNLLISACAEDGRCCRISLIRCCT